MQPYVGLGNSLQTAQGGAAGGVGGWVELGRTTLGSAGNLDISSLPDKRYYMFLNETLGTGHSAVRFNSDTGSNYARRWDINGGTEFTGVSQTSALAHNGVGSETANFTNMFIINNSANEKLVISHSNYATTAGAGTAPSREEHVMKWANTSAQITSIDFDATNFGIGSILKVWGSD